MKSVKEKLTSRRFWLTVAAFIAGIAGVIAGLSTDNETLLIIGAVCSAVATMIYNICEAAVDAANETIVVEPLEEATDDGDTDSDEIYVDGTGADDAE